MPRVCTAAVPTQAPAQLHQRAQGLLPLLQTGSMSCEHFLCLSTVQWGPEPGLTQHNWELDKEESVLLISAKSVVYQAATHSHRHQHTVQHSHGSMYI